MVAVVSDIHIKLNSHPGFERGRVLLLANQISLKNYNYVIINGDLLDSSRPTLDEVELAQQFIDIIAKESRVYLLDGNHEAVNVKKHTSTYDKIRMHNCRYIKDSIIDLEGVTYRMVSWSQLGALGVKGEADVLVTHVRSSLGAHIEAERCMNFLQDYKLCILGDIHTKHSPAKNAHYTSSPYAVGFTSGSPKGSYIELNGLNWSYVDLNFAQKVKLTGKVEDFKDFAPNTKDIYKVIVEGTIEDLRTLKYYPNVSYSKVVTSVEAEEVPIPESIDLLDLVVLGVCKVKPFTQSKQKVKNIIKELI